MLSIQHGNHSGFPHRGRRTSVNIRHLVQALLVICLLLLSNLVSAAPSLLVSDSPYRSGPVSLAGADLTGDAFIFIGSPENISRVRFYLDTPPPATARQTENVAPYDFSGTASDDTAYPFDTETVSDGQHSVYAQLSYLDGTTQTLSAMFTINNAKPALSFSESILSFSFLESDPQVKSKQVSLQASSPTTSTVYLTDDADWLSVSPASGVPPMDITLTVDPAGLVPGEYSGTLEANGEGVSRATLSVTMVVVADQASEFYLMVSTQPDRSSASTLRGAAVSGDIYVFVPSQTGMSKVQFYIDNPGKAGLPNQTEGLAPYDMAGTRPDDTAVAYDSTLLSNGDHTVTAVITTGDSLTHEVSDFFTVVNDGPLLSFNPTTLAGSSHVDNPEPFTQSVQLSAADSSNASFSLTSDTSWLTAAGDSTTTPASITVTINPTGLLAGSYTGTLRANANGYTEGSLTFGLTVIEDATGLITSPTSLYFSGQPDTLIASQSLSISHAASEAHDFTASTNMPWLQATPASGTTPQIIDIEVDSTGKTTGSFSGIITLTSPTTPSVDIPVTMELASNDKCAPVVCNKVKVSLPYQLTFTESQGHLPDKNGWGSGFTWIDKPSNGTGYIPDKLDMNFHQGVLQYTTTPGIQFRANNTQDNALGVGFAAPNQITHISTEILNLPAGTGNYEQAGLWFGNDEDNYTKLVAISTPQGLQVHYQLELLGSIVTEKNISVNNLVGADIVFSMTVNPYQKSVGLSYRINGGTSVSAGTLFPPDEFFSFDAAGIDPVIGTRSFAGIFATHRHGPNPITYLFDEFTLQKGEPPTSPDAGLEFIRKDYNLDFPTSMTWGPDNRLYVTELFGVIHALSFDEGMNLLDDEIILSLVNDIGPRLTLGITTSPSSTAADVELWVAHSSPSIDNGEVNSGMVTRLSGSGFSSVDHRISGLPRAIANHSINSIHFGDDNRLYIAVGGNTGAGAPNQANTEFGERAEQPLSAAILVADVFSPQFDGTCDNTSDMYGPAPCDVVTYATGLRNSYDFAFHSNGNMYATDNGLGVTGTYPPQPEPVCTGFGSTASYTTGGHNPGPQPDLLLRIEEGKYYGHPNQYRDECVFKDGSYQNVAPLPNWIPPLFEIGEHTSSNAIIEYRGGQGCVGDFLNGQLLITNYSIGDDIYRILLNDSGDAVIEGAPLITGFNDPLPLTGNPAGVLFVGQFGGSKLTSLQPVSLGCWNILAPSPSNLLDASAASLGNTMYVVGGKNASGHLSTLWIYDSLTDSWSQGPNLPGVGVENAAVVAHNGLIYVFGGSTAPFSGAVNNAAVYSPASNSWQALPPMPTARGGATAQSINGQLVVVGGMAADGASLAVVEAYNPSTGQWNTLPSMQIRRDNPGSAVLNNELYVFGGRTRNADGSEPEPALASVEKYGAGSWQIQTPMPTGRRAMSVGTANGKAQITGGEHNPNNVSGVFEQNEEYDPSSNSWRNLTVVPTPRHGAATATIGETVHIVGGGVQSGSSYTTIHEALRF
ncbi:hypothetical protein KUV44_00300 [Marinobacter daepoensis]|uniref:BACON domain-containing protein n=1 Tax=Marinobacter daepoensis TaxID=262077 RepID=A0ABS3BAJ4_9GAMM|nr:kelch repeat-containing protein [Marinobacter daepoensis]MBN7768885.1 hypothetical protein [Marinobacter daepoensis]MBY6077575.1 hypothetical protein [Marinobacter daepoensis]